MNALTFLVAFLGAAFSIPVCAEPVSVLFVGNSFTFGRAPPVLQYNAAAVNDMNLQNWLNNQSGSNADEPHPWGGIPAIFKKFTVQAGLDYDVALSARNAATLRGHYLNTNGVWDLRINIASRKWDVVVLQEQSDEPLAIPSGNPARFTIFADKLEKWIHDGAAESFRESQLYPGGPNTLRNIPANPNANPAARVYLYQTWARPDLTYVEGAPYFGRPIEAMADELRLAYLGEFNANGRFAGISRVGEAFIAAVQGGVALRNPYAPQPGLIDLWWDDHFHPSKYGSYLSALVHFHTITGLNPLSLGAAEQAAAELGISPEAAVQLQRIAQATVAPDLVAPATNASVSVLPNAAGWNNSAVTVSLSVADETNGSGVKQVSYTTSGAQAGGGAFARNGSFTVNAEGTTTIRYFATDNAGNAELPRTLTVRIDATPPAISGLPEGCTLWPPNHRMVDVATVSADGGASPLASFSVAVASSEPANAAEADIATAGAGLGPRTVSVRAERSGKGGGRVYSITAQAADAAGNTARASANCVVPHNQ